MKKTFLLIAALLMMGSAAFAGGGLGIAIGPKVGFQTAKLSYDGADIKADFSNHFTAGIFGRVNVGRFYVQPEVLYLRTSNLFNVKVSGTGSDNIFDLPTGAEAQLTLNSVTLQVPIMLGYGFDLGPVTLRAQVGPTAGFTLSSKTLADYTISTSGVEEHHKDVELSGESGFDTKSIAWGLQAGLGADFLGFTLDINYNFGLSKILEPLNGTELGKTFDFGKADTSSQKMFMVTIGYKLVKLGK